MGEALPVEHWRPVVGWEGFYSVSTRGRVRSEPREVLTSHGRLRRYRGRILRPATHPSGYRNVQLSRNDQQASRQVHVLVLEAFTGARRRGMEACHNNGDPGDNRLANLRWDTRSANGHDRVRHGTHNFATRAHCPRRHRLSAPNLVPSLARRGYRDCLACNRARSSVNKAKRAGRPIPDLAALADEHYARILGEAAA